MIVEQDVDDLLVRLESRAVPISGQLHLTDRCNQSCGHCYRAGLAGGEEMTAAEWRRILEALEAEGTFFLTFSGGEPVLHPEWRAIVADTARLGFRWEMFLNGATLAETDIRFLREQRVRELHFSLHGPRELHDRFVGCVGAYDRSLASVRAAVAAGVKTVVKMSVLRTNLSEVDELAATVKNLGAIFAPSYFILPRFLPGDDRFLADRLDADGIATCEARYPDWTGRPALSTCPDDSPPQVCNLGWNRFAIDPNGDLHPCCQVSEVVGNVRQAPFREVWRRSPTLNRLRRMKGSTIPACAECSLLAQCKFRCMGHFHQATGRYDQPAPAHCAITAAWARAERAAAAVSA